MNNIITLRRLSEQIAKEAGVEQEQAEQFVRALASEIGNALAARESVKVRGIGEFKVTDGHVDFAPDTALAETINSPFSMFEPEELHPDITADDLKNSAAAVVIKSAEPIVEPVEVEPEPIVVPVEAKIEPAPEVALVEAKVEAEPEPEVEPVEAKAERAPIDEQPPQPVRPAVVAEPKTVPTVQIQPFDDEDDDENEEYETITDMQQSQRKPFPVFWAAWGAVLGLIIGVAMGFFVHDPIERMLEPSLSEDYDEAFYDDEEYDGHESLIDSEQQAVAGPEIEAELAQQVAEATAAPAATTLAPAQEEEVYDTIREGNSLGSMAKKHYGSNIYWVYIYLENQSKIKNPNSVSAGTTLKIPPLSKYATKATEAENKADAQKKVNEILSKYRR